MASTAQLAQHLSHLGLEDTFVLESGQTLTIDNNGARKGEPVTVERVCIDSGSISDVVERCHGHPRLPPSLSEDGFVLHHHYEQKLGPWPKAPEIELAAASCRWMKEPTFFAMPAKWS